MGSSAILGMIGCSDNSSLLADSPPVAFSTARSSDPASALLNPAISRLISTNKAESLHRRYSQKLPRLWPFVLFTSSERVQAASSLERSRLFDLCHFISG